MQKKKRLFWQIYPSYILITLIAILAISIFASGSMKEFYYTQTRKDLEVRAQLLEGQIEKQLSPLNAAQIDQICKQSGAATETRFTVILPSGKVVGDSEEEPAMMVNHADRPEVVAALRSEIGISIRYSETLQKNMMYVAHFLERDNVVTAIVRSSVPLDAVEKEIVFVQVQIGIAGLILALLAAGMSMIVSRRIIRPIKEMKQGAQHFAAGNLNHKLLVPDSEEMSDLANAMNLMAAQLDERIKTETSQRNKLEAILSSMVEGVIAVDKDERVLSINPAAADIFQVDEPDLQGRSVQEMIRSLKLQRFVKRAVSSAESVEGDIILHQFDKRILHTQSVSLRDATDQRIGTLFLLNDVTQLRRLENMRRDFAANVSHEIKTPITAIKGFVETLLHNPDASGDEIKRFLGIIEKNINRLMMIIEDLLDLSRIEREGDREEIELEEGSVSDILESALQACQTAAGEKHIKVETKCDQTLKAHMDAYLLERAVVNLLDNAIKYSDAGSVVHVDAEQTDTDIILQFKDHGIGISKEHLPRLFERFYRVDKARSRKLGGTGLGLAIVKHIIQLHGGEITVESALQKGTTFVIRIPKTPEPLLQAGKDTDTGIRTE